MEQILDSETLDAPLAEVPFLRLQHVVRILADDIRKKVITTGDGAKDVTIEQKPQDVVVVNDQGGDDPARGENNGDIV